MDFENYLLNELYTIANNNGITSKIHVAEYRSFKMPDNPEDLLFVIRYITGNYVGDVKTQPLQIFCYCELNDMASAYLILDEFSKSHNNLQFKDGNNFIKMNFETPVSMRNFIQSETGYRASVYAFGTYIECAGSYDFENISVELNDEEVFNIPYLTATLGYAAVLNTTKMSGQQLNVSIKQEAGITLSMTLMNTNNDFCNKIRSIVKGVESGNYLFKFTFKEDEDNDFELDMRLESVTWPSDKTSASALTLTFRG